MEDGQILALYLRRSEEAIVQTDAKYGNYCFRIAYQILANREDSEESVNEAYLRAWEAIPPSRPPILGTFLGKITRNLSIDRWRERNAQKRGGNEFALCLDELGECVSGQPDPETAAMQKETAESLNRFLRDLPEIQRRVFLCRYWYMDSVADIAEEFGFSRAKVTAMLHRTRMQLRRRMEKEGML